MLLSIIVPVYNVEKYIRQCLDSIIYQDFSDFELILVDDGSADKSGDICDEYATKDSRIRVIHKENEGLLMTRRVGLKQSKGDYICQIDSDDYLKMGALKEIADALRKQPADMLLFGYNVVDDNGNILERHHNVFPDNTVIDEKKKKELVYKIATTTWLNNAVTRVVKRELFTETETQFHKKMTMGEDLLQGIPLYSKAKHVIYLARPYYNYRYNLAGISKKYCESYLSDYMYISKFLEKLCVEVKLDESQMSDFFNRYMKDVYKYLMQFIYMKMPKDKYLTWCNDVDRDELFARAQKYSDKKNVILRIMTRYKFSGITCLIIKYFLKKRLFYIK